MTNETVYVLRPERIRNRSVLIISEVRRVGQRFAEAVGEGYWVPRGIFEILDLGQCPSLSAARRFIKKLPPASPLPSGFQFRDALTFTGSTNGPGFWPIDDRDGPLFAIVGKPTKIDPLNPTFITDARLK